MPSVRMVGPSSFPTQVLPSKHYSSFYITLLFLTPFMVVLIYCSYYLTILGDFTPVCTTELAKMAQHSSEFYKKGVKLLGLSCDDVESHNEWIKDIEAYIVSLFHIFHTQI